jgi:hypothetical protein
MAMTKEHNTEINGNSWSEATKRAVWNKGQVIEGYPSETWRRDKYGKAIKWPEYGNRESDFGWEIGRAENEKSNDLSNLQLLHWKNVGKGAQVTINS